MRQFYEDWECVFANRQPTTVEIEIDLLAVNRPPTAGDLQQVDLQKFFLYRKSISFNR